MPQRLRAVEPRLGGLPARGRDRLDNAAPGDRLDDLGYAAWKHLNIDLLRLPVAKQLRRLSVFASAYGAPADDVLLAAMDTARRAVSP